MYYIYRSSNCQFRIKHLASAGFYLACKRRRISGCRFSPPTINPSLHSQANLYHFIHFLANVAVRERKKYFIRFSYNCIVFTNFQLTKLYSFQNLSLGFILKICSILKMSQISALILLFKINSYKKKRVLE